MKTIQTHIMTKFELIHMDKFLLFLVLFFSIMGVQAQKTPIIRNVHNKHSSVIDSKPKTSNDSEQAFLQFTCDVKDAILYIDGLKTPQWKIKKNDYNYSTNTHYVRVTAKGYKDFVSCIPFTPQLTSYNIQLEEDQIPSIYINEVI